MASSCQLTIKVGQVVEAISGMIFPRLTASLIAEITVCP